MRNGQKTEGENGGAGAGEGRMGHDSLPFRNCLGEAILVKRIGRHRDLKLGLADGEGHLDHHVHGMMGGGGGG